MTSFYGDLIVPNINPIEAAQRYTASEIRLVLEDLTQVAERLRLGKLWAKAAITGPDGEKKYPGASTKEARIGISMEFACSAGIGFLRDYYLEPDVPADALKMLSHGNPNRRAFAEKRLATVKARVAIRKPEIQAIHTIAEAVSGQYPFPVRIATNIQAGWVYTFEEAYRRRLAYALGFEASITEKSLTVYEERLATLIAGSLTDLVSVCPAVDESHAFSIYLNLLASLDGATAYQTSKDEVHPDLSSEVTAGVQKRTFLVEHLQEAAENRMKTLNSDGCIAVRALLAESELIHQRGRYYRSVPPLWGKESPSNPDFQIYQVS